MNSLTKIILFVCILITSLFAQNNKYWLVDEFAKLNPSQQEVSQSFNALVQNSSVPIAIEQKNPVKIVMVYPGNQISDYWRRSKLSFEKRMNELGIKHELIDHFTNPGAAREQSKQLLKAIKNDTDYLIFTLDIKKHSKFIERIISNQKPKLILQNITTPLKKWAKKQPFFYVGFDHVIGSQMLADYYLRNVSHRGNYAVLYGTDGYVSQMRGDEFINYMATKSNLKLVDSYYTNYKKSKAMNATAEILDNNKDLEFIYACSTDIALGAIEVIKQRGLTGKVLVNGWGGGSNELKAIEQGTLDVTVMRMNDDNGVAMAEAIKLDVEGKTSSVPQIYSGDFQLIKKGVNEDDLGTFKNRAFRYSR